MSAHTPAPWRIEGTNNGLFIAGAKPGYLAEVRDCGSGDVADNARLIAAAPDLLSALQGVQAAWDENRLLTSDEAAAVRAAIAKATGGQS